MCDFVILHKFDAGCEAAAGIDTSTAANGTIIATGQVQDLPLNGGDFTQLLTCRFSRLNDEATIVLDTVPQQRSNVFATRGSGVSKKTGSLPG